MRLRAAGLQASEFANAHSSGLTSTCSLCREDCRFSHGVSCQLAPRGSVREDDGPQGSRDRANSLENTAIIPSQRSLRASSTRGSIREKPTAAAANAQTGTRHGGCIANCRRGASERQPLMRQPQGTGGVNSSFAVGD